MKKFIQSFSILVIALFALSVFGWMSVHVHKGDKDFGFLNEPVKFMTTFLDQFKKTVKEVKKKPPTFLKTEAKHSEINELKTDLKALISYSDSKFSREVALINLKSDSVLYKWSIPEKVRDHDRILNPIMYPNKDLVYFFNLYSALKRIDSAANEIWTQDSILPHHAINVDSAGYLWVCTNEPPAYSATGKFKMYGRTVYFIDDFITKVDPDNGNILFHKSIAEILKENNISSYLLHSQSGKDPLHLNDVEPALKTTKYYREGDVFISLKQNSLILHYRPATNELIRAIKGDRKSVV